MRLGMAKYLIDSFSRDLSQEAAKQGEEELSNLLASGAIAKPEVLSEALNIDNITPYAVEYADKVVKNIWERYPEEQWSDVYWYVKNAAWGLYFGDTYHHDNMISRLSYQRNLEELGIKTKEEIEQFLQDNVPSDSKLLLKSSIEAMMIIIYRLLRKITKEQAYR